MNLEPTTFATAEAIANIPGTLLMNVETKATRIISNDRLTPAQMLTLVRAIR